jgi:hypothetical protein
MSDPYGVRCNYGYLRFASAPNKALQRTALRAAR